VNKDCFYTLLYLKSKSQTVRSFIGLAPLSFGHMQIDALVTAKEVEILKS